jgi:hypothetical protein
MQSNNRNDKDTSHAIPDWISFIGQKSLTERTIKTPMTPQKQESKI